MKKSEHTCATCDNTCPREYPFCTACWRQVPVDLRKAVRDELAKTEPDNGALYYTVQAAAASLRNVETTPATEFWERAWIAAGYPELEIVGGRIPQGAA